MPRPFKPATAAQVGDVRDALALLIVARDKLQTAGSPLALDKVRAAISSTKGALRHAEGRRTRASLPDGFNPAA